MVAAGNAWQTTRGEGFCLIRLGASSPGNLQRVVEPGGSMHRSLHRRGQLLVLGAALLGAVLGGAMGLVVEHAGTGTAGAAPRPRRGSIEDDALGATGSERTSGAGRASCWMVTSAGFGAWLAA